MLSVLVTDFLQFIVMSVGLIAVTVLILTQNRLGPSGHDGVERTTRPADSILLSTPNWDGSSCSFNALLNLAAVLTWQTTISRLLAAKDAKTGQKIYTRTSFFFVCRFLIPGIWGIAALTVLGRRRSRVCRPTLQENDVTSTPCRSS